MRSYNERALSGVLQGVFYIHPTDEDLSVGTPEMKKPLGGCGSGYSNCGTAVAAEGLVPVAGCVSGRALLGRGPLRQ